MLRFCEACNGCSFYFLASVSKNLVAKTVFCKLLFETQTLPMFPKCFLILLNFSSIVLIDMCLKRKICNQISILIPKNDGTGRFCPSRTLFHLRACIKREEDALIFHMFYERMTVIINQELKNNSPVNCGTIFLDSRRHISYQ